MISSLIKSITIDYFEQQFSFEGEFAFLNVSDVKSRFTDRFSFKTKFYTLIVVENGSGNLVIDHEVYPLKKGGVFFINYHQIFDFSQVEDFKGEILLFTRSFYNLIYTGNKKIKNETAFLDLPSFIGFSGKEFSSFKTGILDMKREFLNPALLSKEVTCLVLKASMLKFIRKTDKVANVNFRTNRKTSYVDEFRNLVELHFKELKRTSQYSEKMAISANYLNALIKEKLDISAENVIQNRVILEAERLLLNTHLSVLEISFELGFSDKSHFGKYFKKITQVSPNNFRKNNNNLNNKILK